MAKTAKTATTATTPHTFFSTPLQRITMTPPAPPTIARAVVPADVARDDENNRASGVVHRHPVDDVAAVVSAPPSDNDKDDENDDENDARIPQRIPHVDGLAGVAVAGGTCGPEADGVGDVIQARAEGGGRGGTGTVVEDRHDVDDGTTVLSLSSDTSATAIPHVGRSKATINL